MYRLKGYDSGLGKQPWDGDCLEFFILPEKRLKVYWEIVVNPENEVFDGLHQNYRWGGFSGHPEEDMQGLKTFTKKTESGYAVELAIPFKELPAYTKGNVPEAGQKIWFMFVRTDKGQRKTPCPFLYDGHNIFGYVQGTFIN